MLAKPGRLYAQLVDGRVHWLFTAADLPEWNDEQVPAIDVTDLKTPPAIGDRYVDGAFVSGPTDEERKAAALAALDAIDRDSIRAMREYILAQSAPPAELVQAEERAVAERAKLNAASSGDVAAETIGGKQ